MIAVAVRRTGVRKAAEGRRRALRARFRCAIAAALFSAATGARPALASGSGPGGPARSARRQERPSVADLEIRSDGRMGPGSAGPAGGLRPPSGQVFPESRQILHLLEYVAGDYPDAFASRNAAELDEQVGFLAEARQKLSELPDRPSRQGLLARLDQVSRMVRATAAPSTVEAEVRRIIGAVASTYPSGVEPPAVVSRDRGAELYRVSCAACHGEDGRARVPIAGTMDPRPVSFADPERMKRLSPLKAFDTITFGISGTAMPSYSSAHGTQDIWNLAFYVFTLRPGREGAAPAPTAPLPPTPRLPLAELTDLTDERLEARLAAQGIPSDRLEDVRRAVRVDAAYARTPSPLQRSLDSLERARAVARAGDRKQAAELALAAYLDGFEEVEPLLKVIDRHLATTTELSMQRLPRDLRAGVPLASIDAQVGQLRAFLEEAERLLAASRGDVGWFPFVSSLLIMVREGLEAILVLAMLLAVLAKVGCSDLGRLVYRGAFWALVAGLVIWAAAQRMFVLAAAHREAFEGVTTLIAAALLYWAGLWMLSRLEARRWMAMIKRELSGSLSTGSRGGVASLAFLAVFREVVETILFYQALVNQFPGRTLEIVQGAAAGIVALAVLAYLILAAGMKLPLGAFFAISSAGMLVLAVLMTGNAALSFGEAGWFLPGAYPILDSIGGPTGAGRMLQVLMVAGFALAVLPLVAARFRPAASAA
jgi:high-affinity iron transporter